MRSHSHPGDTQTRLLSPTTRRSSSTEVTLGAPTPPPTTRSAPAVNVVRLRSAASPTRRSIPTRTLTHPNPRAQLGSLTHQPQQVTPGRGGGIEPRVGRALAIANPHAVDVLGRSPLCIGDSLRTPRAERPLGGFRHSGRRVPFREPAPEQSCGGWPSRRRGTRLLARRHTGRCPSGHDSTGRRRTLAACGGPCPSNNPMANETLSPDTGR